MPPQKAMSWWSEPEHLVLGLLNVIGGTLGGDLAIWIRLDRETGLAKLVEIVDPNPTAQSMVERLRARNTFPLELLGPLNADSGKPLVIPEFGGFANAKESIPQPWSDYFAKYPIYGIIAVPILLESGSTGVLVTCRRTATTPYSADDLGYVESGALRLAGRSINESLADRIDSPRQASKEIFVDPRRLFRVREFFVGAIPPALVTVVVSQATDSDRFRPAALLLLACVAAAIFGGLRSAILSGVASTAALWWAFTPVKNSWSFATKTDAVGVGIFVIAATGVIVLVLRLDAARSKESLERQFSNSLIEDSPIAMAVLDRDLKFRRVNKPMAEFNGRSATDHVGLRPGDLSPLAGQMYEHHLVRVRDSGQPIVDHRLRISVPAIEYEREWKFNLRPMHNLDSEVVGIGVTIVDITEELATLRHSENLFRLAESLSISINEQQIGLAICSFLTEVFHGRSAVAFRHDEELKIVASAGFGDDETVELAPLLNSEGINRAIIDSDSVAMPLRREETGAAFGAIYVGWAKSRPQTQAMTVLLRTVSSLVTLALARIAASELAHRDEFRHSLEAMLDDVVIARSIRVEGGEITDFQIEFANRSSLDGSQRDARTIVGRMVCDVYPNWRDSGMFQRLREVVESGIPYQVHRMPFSDFLNLDDSAERYMSLQVAKLGDGYIAASRDVSNLVAADKAELALTLQNETERSALQLLQSAALPHTLPTSSNVRIAAVYEPSDPRLPVGGDWYDAFTLDDHRIALVIADVAGHGRTAAVFMVQVRNVFRALAVEHLEPGQVMIRANNVTTKLNQEDGPFVTCCYAVLDTRTKTLRWAQAGHFSPFVLHPDGRSTYLTERTGPPLALSSAMHYESSSATLNSGDRVIMFTDGLIERRRESLDVGLTRLAEVTKAHAALQAQEFVQALAATVTDRFDDLALMCVELVASN